MATTNQEIGNTYVLMETGPTSVNLTVEAAVKELELVITTGVPAETLRGHRSRPALPQNVRLDEGEFLYGRAYNNQDPVTAVKS